MRMQQFDLYGFTKGNILEVRQILEKLFNIHFTEHESIYHCGVYYRYEGKYPECLILQSNFDEKHDEWSEEDYSEMKILLYINNVMQFKNIESNLLATSPNGTLLQRDVVKS